MSGISYQITLQEPKLLSDEGTGAAEEQFAALVRRQSRFVFRVAFSVLRNAHDAEDVAQETFLKLYRNQAWKRMADERGFLARAAWRLAVSRLSEKKVPCEVERAEQETPEEELIRLDRDALVQRLVDALPRELRLPLALSTVEGLRSHEIAAVMGIPDGTVRTRIARARKILKERLAVLLEGRHAQ
jgi:RNA polymerase sigma-70 factor, ECF subfamily